MFIERELLGNFIHLSGGKTSKLAVLKPSSKCRPEKMASDGRKS